MRFKALDGFRGICALIVALYHFPVENHVLGHRFFLPNGQMLMDFFFVMSGFLIAGAYGERLQDWAAVGGFAKSRFARLWPLHAATLAVFVGVEAAKAALVPGIGMQPPFSGGKSIPAIVSNLLLIHSLHVHRSLTWNAPSWTVSVEFATYLIFAASVVLWPRRPVRAAAAFATIAAAGVILVARRLDANYDWGLFRCLYGFFCGAITYRLWKTASLRLTGRRKLATALEATALLAVLAYIICLGGPPFGFAGPLIFSAFIWLYAAEQGAVTRGLGWAPLVGLGTISYSIYLVHDPIIVMSALSLRLFERVSGVNFAALGYTGLDQMSFVSGPSMWTLDGAMLVYLVVVIVVARWTYRVIEGPGRQLFDPRPQRAARLVAA